MNGRWVKSQKIVKFPKRNFNVSNFVVPKGDTEPKIIDVTNDAPAETEDLKDSGVLGPQAGISINAIEMSSEGAGQGRVDSGRGSSVVVNGDTDHSDTEDPAKSEDPAQPGDPAPSKDPAPSEDGAVEKSKDRRERPAALRLDTSGGALPLMNGDCKSDIVNGHGEAEEGDEGGEEGGAKDQDSGYGTLESGQGDGSHSQSGSNSPSKPKLKKQASLLTPPVDATGSHPLLHPQTKPEEDVDDGQMYDLYGVVVSTPVLT